MKNTALPEEQEEKRKEANRPKTGPNAVKNTAGERTMLTAYDFIEAGLIGFGVAIAVKAIEKAFNKPKNIRDLCGISSSKLKKLKKERMPLAGFQKNVDWFLASRAGRLQEEFDREVTVRICLSEEPTDENFDELKKAKRAVRTQKRIFWEYHRTAKKAGFTVKDKYSDYLPSKAESAMDSI